MLKLPSWPNFVDFREIDLGLDRVFHLLDKLGNPQLDIANIIHIAGTNGKGSTIAFLRAFLESSGYSVNIYTSPHLVHFNERIRIKGELIGDEYLDELGQKCSKICEKEGIRPTFFEGTTILAILAFAENKADFNIFEVGMGGRLDATNVFDKKLASIITPISYDHQEFLGNSLERIAYEKAGIIQQNDTVFIANQEEVVRRKIIDVSNKHRAKIYEIKEDIIPLPKNIGLFGDHQKENFLLAANVFLTVIKNRDLPNNFISKINWSGRLQKLAKNHKLQDREIFLDGGHNMHAANAIARWVSDNNIDYMIIGMNKTKNLKEYLDIISKTKVEILFTEMTIFQDCYKLEDIKEVPNIKQGFRNFYDAILYTTENSKILICGSLFLAGEVLEKIMPER